MIDTRHINFLTLFNSKAVGYVDYFVSVCVCVCVWTSQFSQNQTAHPLKLWISMPMPLNNCYIMNY